MNICFLEIPCENVYNTFLGRLFLVTLDALASTIHLKMRYHNNFGKPIFNSMDLHRDHLIHVNILKDLLATTVTSENKRKKICKTIVRTIDLNAREDETLRDDELGSPSGIKAKTLRTI